MKTATTNTAASTHLDTEATVSGEWMTENNMLVRSYHELADQTIVETDLISDFKANLQLLEEMQGRMSFVMKEVRYVLKLNL